MRDYGQGKAHQRLGEGEEHHCLAAHTQGGGRGTGGRLWEVAGGRGRTDLWQSTESETRHDLSAQFRHLALGSKPDSKGAKARRALPTHRLVLRLEQLAQVQEGPQNPPLAKQSQ